MVTELPAALTLTVYRDHSGFTALKPEWNTLLAHSAFNSIFLTWEWQTTWWNCLGAGELCLIAFQTPAGEWVGIAPLFLADGDSGREIHLIGCTEVADYLDIIIARGHEAAVNAALVDFLAGPAAPAWDAVSLCNLHDLSPTHRLLPPLAVAAGWQVTVAQEDVAPFLPLPDSFETYLDSLDKKQRHELRRKRGKLEREAGTWRWFQVEGGVDLELWVDHFIDLHRRASAEKNAFMTPVMSAYFHQIARAAADQGWLRLAFIEINGELASTYLCFDYDDRIWLYNSGFDPSVHGQLSPGIVLNSLLIEDAIVRGRRVFDFLQGNEIYKYRFGAIDAPVLRVSWRRS